MKKLYVVKLKQKINVSLLIFNVIYPFKYQQRKEKRDQHLSVYLRDCPQAEECPYELVELSTHACDSLLYSVRIRIDDNYNYLR